MAKIQNSAELREDLAELKEKMKELEEGLGENLRSSLKENIGNLKNKMIDAQTKVENKVADKPLESLAVAFATGLIIGAAGLALIKRK